MRKEYNSVTDRAERRKRDSFWWWAFESPQNKEGGPNKRDPPGLLRLQRTFAAQQFKRNAKINKARRIAKSTHETS